jgi:hypothetical protein
MDDRYDDRYGADGDDHLDAGAGYGAVDGYDGDGDDDERTWSQTSRRQRAVLIASVAVAMVLLAVGAAVAAVGLSGDGETVAEPPPLAVAASAAGPSATRSEPPTATPSPSAKASSRPPSARPTRSLAPPKETRLPPPPPPPAPTGCQPSYRGTSAAKTLVKQKLTAASQRAFSRSVPSLRIPAKLLYAVAWQESGWQSAIIACDGGIGTMQVMPDTATWMNNTYETNWDVNAVEGNVMLGGQLLAWLTKYFGDQLGTYDLNAADTTLLDAVISAYNVGPGNVDLARGRDGIVNWQYVNNVRALMVNCPCATI